MRAQFGIGVRCGAAMLLVAGVGLVATATSTAARAEPAGARNPWHAVVLQRQLDMAARFGVPAAAERPDGTTIVGGVVAPATAYRFQVALLDAATPSNFNAQFCGGTLIHAQWVLTAAHCVEGGLLPSQLQILTGTNDLAAGGTRRTVVKIKIHPSYNTNTQNNDVALIKLTAPTVGIPLASVISLAQESTFAPVGEPARAVGWGDTNPSDTIDTFPAKLRHVQVPVVSRALCNGPNSYAGTITTRMVCAGLVAGGKDTCQGDSGGPLFVGDAANVFQLQFGITSFGTGCAQPNFFGVYTRVAIFRTWILAQIAAG